MVKHTKTGLTLFYITNEIQVLPYLDWLRYFHWSIEVDKTIEKILE